MGEYFEKYDIERIQRHLPLVLAFMIICLAVSYVYLVNNSVINAVVLERNNKEIAQLIIKIAEQENAYINRRNELNLELAHSLGYKDDFSRVHFSNESTNVSGNLSWLGNEI